MKKLISAVLLLVVALAVGASAQLNTSLLKPPKGHKVALIVFEDLQCPDCGRAEPLLMDAVKQYKIPLVRHDFPLPQHNWAFDAHVIARYFDTHSPALGEKFRHWVFENQTSINKQNLRGMAERFADENKLTLPTFVDPKGELAAKVQQDFKLGQEVGVQFTPTILVVSNTQRGEPFIEEVRDRTQLFQMIEEMQKKAGDAKPAAANTAKKSVKRVPSKSSVR